MTGSRRVLRDIAVFAMVFQVFHFIEHAAQLTYWFGYPTKAPFLTPWAVAGRDILAVDGTHGGGNELLHLVGNLIFLGGIVALALVARHSGRKTVEIPYLRKAMVLQGIHVAEHVLLTFSYFILGLALGFTTLFGAAQGAFGSSLRIWAHFLLNLVGTYYVLRAAWEMYGLGMILDRSTGARKETRRAGIHL
ncbi:MAG: DUF6008 family protein [Acidimicrobiia bacterium]